MSAGLDAILDPDNLNRAWRRLRGDKAVWLPGLPRAEMERDLLRHLLTLIEEVRDGRYRPAPLRRFTVRKADGRQRVLSAFCLRDKLLQRAVLQVIGPRIEPTLHAYSFAYRPGLNVDLALRQARQHIGAGLDWLVDADIRRFFDRIPHRALLKMLKGRVPEKDVRRLLEQWLDAGSPADSLFAARRGIPQGAITSPLLCNLYLDPFDRALDRHNIPAVRYADDFLLFTPSKETADRALALADAELTRLDLALHPDKTRVARAGPSVIFLGQPLPGPRR